MRPDDMALPAVQRDALIERVARLVFNDRFPDREWLREPPDMRAGWRDQIATSLAAIEEQYVLIPKDQVTVERWVSPSDSRARLTTEWRAVSE